VEITRDLFHHVQAEGHLVFDRKGERLRVLLAWDLEAIMGAAAPNAPSAPAARAAGADGAPDQMAFTSTSPRVRGG